MTNKSGGAFDAFVRRATGGDTPYEYQREIAASGLPELLEVPTGCGKTMAAVLPWLFRRREAGPDTRHRTPAWLVFVLPMRVLVEQTAGAVRAWITNLGLGDEVGVFTLLGGEPPDRSWRQRVGQDTVIIGTLDMILSRAINRGYGESRFIWPIDFGLLNAGCHFVFDEVQLMGPALPTSRQLQGFRDRMGTLAPVTSTWMSATVDERDLLTVDAPTIDSRIGLTDADRHGPLARRLDAPKIICRLDADGARPSEAAIAAELVGRHRPGTLSLAVLNTVARARELWHEVRKLDPDAEVVLLHSRFRPLDRARQAELALGAIASGTSGRIVISTQVVEAGVDLSSRLLVTDVAPWPSLVQRMGRCNRTGLDDDAEVLWLPAGTRPEPYLEADLEASSTALAELEGKSVTPATIGAHPVPVVRVVQPVLRRKDLLDLFDTTPDVSGNDIDVSPYIRAADDSDIAVAWRVIPEAGPDPHAPMPERNERCSVPLAEARQVAKTVGMWAYDPRAARGSGTGRYVRLRPDQLRPGLVVLTDVATGRYTPEAGWSLTSKAPVDPVGPEREASPLEEDLAVGDDPLSIGFAWQALDDHLADTQRAVGDLLDRAPDGVVPTSMRLAAERAAALHDVGKAHPVFQRSMRRQLAGAGSAPPESVVLAKSGGTGRLFHERRYFRHELVSALMLMGEGAAALTDVDEPDLVIYLVAAHHGRVRVGVRSGPQEYELDGTRAVLGVLAGDDVPATRWPAGELPASVLDLGVIGLGELNGVRSWTSRVLALRDRADVGPFRMGTLEAIVRLADWRASGDGWEATRG